MPARTRAPTHPVLRALLRRDLAVPSKAMGITAPDLQSGHIPHPTENLRGAPVAPTAGTIDSGVVMSLDNLNALFLNELKDVYNAEKQILTALPRMAKAAGSPDLATAFTKHRQETEGHVARLEQIFGILDQPVRGKKCKGMEGLLEEGKEILEEEGEDSVIDAALISAAQRVEHYEMAAYGCLRTYAELLGYGDAVELLEQTLAEEEAADKKLSQLADGGINAAALAAGQEAEN